MTDIGICQSVRLDVSINQFTDKPAVSVKHRDKYGALSA